MCNIVPAERKYKSRKSEGKKSDPAGCHQYTVFKDLC